MPTTHIISSAALGIVINAEKNNEGAAFTILSKASGTDFTFLISRSLYNGNWYTHVKVEQGYLNFRYLGAYFCGRITKKNKVTKKTELVTTDAAKAIAFVLDAVEHGRTEWLDTVMEVMHTGKCLRCGRELTDADSIKRGLGPTCASR